MIQESNPYQPPKADISYQQGPQALVPASKGRRFGTLIVDYLLFMGVSFCVGFAAVLIFGQAGLKAIQEIPDLVMGVGILAIYYTFFEGIWGRTPGKFLFGTVVVDESGGKPSFKQVIGRTLCRFIPFEAFSCLGERGWHDSIPSTYVVLARQN